MDTHAEGMAPMRMGAGIEEGEEDLDDPALAAELKNSFGADEEPTAFENLSTSEEERLAGLPTKTLFDRIQADFPRTPSPVYGLGLKAPPAHGKALPSPKKGGAPPQAQQLKAMQAFNQAAAGVQQQQQQQAQQLLQNLAAVNAGQVRTRDD
jgi:hypothetical protein